MKEVAPIVPSFDVATADLCAAIEDGLEERSGLRRSIVHCERRRSAYQTSHPLHELDVTLDDGSKLAMMFKQIFYGPTAPAKPVKPDFIIDPLREIETYRHLLTDAVSGPPAYHGSVVEPERGRYWLFLERVPGGRIWEFRELGVWQAAARWLVRFQARTQLPVDARGEPGTPVIHDHALYRVWLDRALRFTDRTRSADAIGRRRLAVLAEHYDAATDRLEALPRTVVHGELYASNVLIVPSADPEQPPRRVCPLDWELTGIGPGLCDLASLVAGWEPPARESIARAYFEEQRPIGWFGSLGDLLAGLDLCELELAIRMLGWAEDWTPPNEHRKNWLTLALDAAARSKILAAT